MRRIVKICLFIGVIISLAGIALFLPIKLWLFHFLQGVQKMGFWGPVWLGVAYAVSCLLFIPGSLLTLGAGFLFGVPVGTITVSISSTLGALGAFLVGRTFLRGVIASRVEKNLRFKAIDQAISKEGFKIVLLLRLSPVFPFNFLNYALGITKVCTRDYFWASWIGMLPGTLLYVYLGSTVKNLTDLISGKVGEGIGSKIMFGVGLGFTIIVTLFVTRLARKAIQNALPIQKQTP